MSYMISIVTSSRYTIDKKHLEHVAREYMGENEIPNDSSLNVVFVGARKMKHISSQYKHDTIAHPVLTFSYRDDPQGEEKLIGEIFICYPQAILLAAEKDKKVEDMMVFLIKHGIDNIIKS